MRNFGNTVKLSQSNTSELLIPSKLHTKTHPHCGASLNQIDDSIGETKSTGGLDGSRHKLDLGLHTLFLVKRPKEFLGHIGETRYDSATSKSRYVGNVLGDGSLNAQLALAETEVHDAINLDATFPHNIHTSDANVDVTLADVLGNVGSGQEDEGDGQIDGQSDIEAGLATVVDASTLEHGIDLLKETALLGDGKLAVAGRRCSWGGHGGRAWERFLRFDRRKMPTAVEGACGGACG